MAEAARVGQAPGVDAIEGGGQLPDLVRTEDPLDHGVAELAILIEMGGIHKELLSKRLEPAAAESVSA